MSDDPTVEPRAAVANLVPLSPAQELIWAGQRLHGAAPLYNMAFAFYLEGALDPERFRVAFEALIASRDALRTVIEIVDGRPVQRVLEPSVVAHQQGPLALVDLSATTAPDEIADQLVAQRCRRPLAFDRPMFDSFLVRLDSQRWIWYLCQHHLVTDAWSMMVLQRQLAAEYAPGERQPQPAAPAFLDHLRALGERPIEAETEAFWADHRDLQAPRLFGPPAAAGGTSATTSERRTLALGAERSAALRALASDPEGGALTVDLGLFNLMATLLFAWLYRLSDQHQLAIGAPAHNRLTAAERETAGLLTEVFPLRVEVEAGDRFLDLLAKVRTASAGFLRHAVAGAGAATAHRSLAGVLNFIRGSFAGWPGLEQQIRWLHPGHHDGEHPLRLHVHDLDGTAAAGGELGLQLDLNRSIFSGQRAAMAESSLLRLLDALLADWRQPIGEVDLLDDRRARQLLLAGTGPASSHRRSVIETLLARAGEQPAAVALQLGESEITYGQLIDRIGQLSGQLARLGVGTGQTPRVGVAMTRSPEAVVSILAVMTTGATWVALDPKWPPSRLAWVIADADVDLILVRQPGLADSLGDSLGGVRELVVADGWSEAADLAAVTKSWPALDPQLPAYVLYTSGSTGRPKGVVVSHRALANYVGWARDYYWSAARRPATAADRPLAMAWFSPLTFDLTVSSIFLPLVAGGRVVIYPEPATGADLPLLDVAREDRVDVLKLTPSHLTLLEPAGSGQRRLGQLIFGGEALTGEVVARARAIFGQGVEIHNEYGPTEATVGCVIHSEPVSEAEGHEVVPIGAPIAGLRSLVLDRRLRLLPVGVVGELYLGGRGLAQGYLGQARLTAERFVADPWAEEPGARLYRTGDLACLDPAGRLHFLGRRDGQIKVRGARVELGEIEAALGRHPRIAACAVQLARRPAPEPTAEYCARCALPSTYPDTELDRGGVCNHCRDFDHYRHKVEGYFGERRQLRAILDQNRRLPQRPEFDCLALFSGGKDSTYMVCQLVDMGYRVLAFTLDNGFISDQAKANISRVVEALGIEHQYGTTPAMAEIFVDSLERHANVCQGCFKTIYTLGMQLAQRRRIPFLVTGLSRGQLFETRLTAELFTDLDLDPAGIDRAVLEARKAYHRADDAVSRLLDVEEFRGERIFEQVEIVDFYRFTSVSLDEMLSYLEQRVPWVRPSDTGRSTNCLINDVGIYVHRRRQGFHNYALPYSWDVRLGHKERQAALEELDDQIDPRRVHDILHQIGYPHEAAAEPGGARLVAYYTAEAGSTGDDGPASEGSEIASAELREFLAARLPDFMLPARFVRLAALPLTASGKLDRAALQAPTELRPELAESYHPPRNEVEERLCQVWAETLGIDRVGVRDDFLDLGGDSILATQIAARCHRRGLKLTPAQLFESATIERLAPLCDVAADLSQAVVESPAGELLATAAQCWLMDRLETVPRRWNMSTRLAAAGGSSAAELLAGLEVLARRHEALRAGWVATDGGRPLLRVVAAGDIDWSRQVLTLDLSALERPDRRRQAERVGGQVEFDLARAPLLAALRLVADEQPVELVLVAHHLIVDAVSWSILADDLAAVIARIRRAEAVDLPSPPVSLRRWSARLAERAAAPAVLAQIDYWRPRLELPWARIEQLAASAGPLAGLVRIDRRLGRPDTATLFGKLPQVARVTVEEVLLAAAALAWREVSGLSLAVRMLVERHGREALDPALDPSQTVGWLTSLFPLVLDLPADLEPISALKAVKDQVRQLPARGADYGLLRYLQPSLERRRQLAELDQCQMSFNYLGRVSTAAGNAEAWWRSTAPLELLRPATAPCPTAIELALVEVDGELEIAWGFDSARIRPADRRRLVETFDAGLARLLELATASERPAAAISASDFPLANLDPDKLEKLGAVLARKR